MSAAVAPVNEKQVFVRNLPFDVTNEDLSAFFEEIGPLKNASVAMANGVGKGFGFVKFALEADAHTAIEKLQGQSFRGRKLILELGHKKERKGKNKAEQEVDAEGAETPAVAETPKANKPVKADKVSNAKAVNEAKEAKKADAAAAVVVKGSRQVLVFGVSTDLNKKHFRAVAVKGRKTDVDILKEDHELSSQLHIITPPGKIMLLTASTHKEATDHTAALNNATMHSLIVAYQTQFEAYKKQQDFIAKKNITITKGDKVIQLEQKTNQLQGLDLTKPHKEKLFARTVAQITPEEQRKRKCRLIVRNLSFLATEQNLLDKMSKFGPVVSVELPKKAAEERPPREDKPGKKFPRAEGKESKTPTERSMGFGFVTFLCECDAQAAVTNSAGLKVCNREVAVDFCMSKETYEKFGKKQDETSVADAVNAAVDVSDKQADGESDKDEGSDEEGDEDSNVSSEESVAGSDDVDEDADEGMDEDEGSDEEESDFEGSEEEDETSDEGDNDEDEDASDDAADASDAGATEKPKKEPTEDVHEGCTVFVRGLAFDAEPADIKRALGKFGRIAMAIVVKDKETDMSKGSAFVKFHQADWAAACVEQARVLGGITIKDRMCKIDLAVDRQSAKSIKDSEVAKRGKDKRNLYLANEGLILPGAEDHGGADTAVGKTQSMSEADKEKRQRAQTEKRKKLQNPLFFVSATRLSIRNLSKTVTDKELREIVITAAKNGIKKGLVKRADMEAYRMAQGSDHVIQQLQQLGLYKPNMDLDAVPASVGKHCLKNSKIMLDMQRIRGGAPQSRGYGFAEFLHPAHALACLRELNNNAQYSSHHSAGGAPGIGEGVGGKLIVELSLENIQKVKLLKDREVRQQKRKESSAAESGSVGDSARSAKRQQKAESSKLAKPAAEAKAVEVVESAPAAAAQAPKKPVKSYVVSADTLPVALPEGVNPKHHNKMLERERQKRKRGDKDKEATGAKPAAAAPAVAVAESAESEAPAKKMKTSASAPAAAPAAKPAASSTSAPAAPAAKKPEQAAKNAGAKRKHEEASAPAGAKPTPAEQPQEKKAKPAAPSAPAQVAPAAKAAPPAKKDQAVPAQAPKADKKASAPTPVPSSSSAASPKDAKVRFEGKKDNTKGKGQGTPGKAGHAAGTPSPARSVKSEVSAAGTPQKGVWGGHKRMRAAKKNGKK